MAICYGHHASSNKQAEFIHTELSEQLKVGHVAVYPLRAVTARHNLWLLSVAVIPQVGRSPCLIFDFTWSGLNNIAERLAPMEAMRFGGAL